MSGSILQEHRVIWQEKPVLRAIYTDYYERILSQCLDGRTLEIGGGSGNLKEFASDVITTDIVPAPWLDAAADAQRLPFADASFANVVAIDVLHHIERPVRFLSEALRVLRPGGRIVLLEPGITPISRIIYHLFHPEPVKMRIDPFVDGPLDPNREPFDANQAIPTLLFLRHKQRFCDKFPQLRLLDTAWLSLFAYPLSGGFRRWSFIPLSWIKPMLRAERNLEPILGRLAAFRLFAVLEKRLPQ